MPFFKDSRHCLKILDYTLVCSGKVHRVKAIRFSDLMTRFQYYANNILMIHQLTNHELWTYPPHFSQPTNQRHTNLPNKFPATNLPTSNQPLICQPHANWPLITEQPSATSWNIVNIKCKFYVFSSRMLSKI